MRDTDQTIARKVYFFRVSDFANLKNTLPLCLQKIENLPFNDRGRYLLDPQSDARLCVFPDELEYPLKLRFGRIRRDLLPDIEEKGQLAPLDLSEDAGIIDVCHIIIFEDGYLAAEWNHNGPMLKRLGPYLFQKGGSLSGPLRCLNLFERDIVDLVGSLRSVKVLEIDVPSSNAELAAQADKGLATAIQASRDLGASKKIGLTLTAESGSPKLKNLALNLASLVRGSQRKNFLKLTATGYDRDTGRSRFVDILEEKLISIEIFPRTRERSRSISSDNAYEIIQDAYNRNRKKFVSAAIAEDFL